VEDYSKIFQSHIIRFYHEWGYSRQQFAEIIGISYGRTYSLLSEGGDIGLTLNTMQAISDSLGLPLPLLLKPLESEEWQSILALWKWNPLTTAIFLTAIRWCETWFFPNTRPSSSMNGEK